MKITDTCVDCLLSRINLECSLCGADAALAAETEKECRQVIDELRDLPLSHPQVASRIHRRAYALLENPDPFDELKRSGNRQAAEVCMQVRGRLHTFRDYVHAAVIANIFDYGVKGHAVTRDFLSFFNEEIEKDLYIDDTDKILPLCSRVVYLCDNCGEIVFDKLLIQYLKSHGSQVTLAVKESPILNDATMEDARSLGMDRMVDLLTTTGGGAEAEIGINMDLIPDNLRLAIDNCTIILAKGMANFESISEMENLPPVAYLLAAKCKPVADELGVPVGVKVAKLRRD
ncbi:ARMT1-like domain-containing protein [Methanoregula sp.]|uniref:damage-control phosphatase ARMT1 family protein n=1 Tax=Methanoregula sp. TaxID=2052170 RepID=UPI00236DF51D|nr:ARMT1-like domain-containing protein [Methanoregula sp.]MDD1685446.1 ARMT1-like domain-containing protein [Methanoregula sp.]